MSLKKNYNGYQSFQYPEKDVDYESFSLSRQDDRVPVHKVPLDATQVERVKGLHHYYSKALSLKASETQQVGMEYDEVEYVKGLGNPTDGSYNIIRWLVKHDYKDEDIIKVMGGNAMRLLREVY